jgi:hypothetical protein
MPHHLYLKHGYDDPYVYKRVKLILYTSRAFRGVAIESAGSDAVAPYSTVEVAER